MDSQQGSEDVKEEGMYSRSSSNTVIVDFDGCSSDEETGGRREETETPSSGTMIRIRKHSMSTTVVL